MPKKPTPAALENRLIDFGSAVCEAVRQLPNDLVGSHLSRQVVRSATSQAANYAEARGAESRRDFVHKIQICLKELRETLVWLRFAGRLGGHEVNVGRLEAECNELVSIFVQSVKTARDGNRRPGT
jgi:four helix bundle protein